MRRNTLRGAVKTSVRCINERLTARLQAPLSSQVQERSYSGNEGSSRKGHRTEASGSRWFMRTDGTRLSSSSSKDPIPQTSKSSGRKEKEQSTTPQFVPELKHLQMSEVMDLIGSGKASLFDVRSPGEFAEDHIPGSENVPVLDDDERQTVGTLHKVSNKVEARQVGAALIAKRIASHLDTRFVPSDAHRLKIIYCARGGLRSQSMAMILTLIGYEATTIEGGYRSYRQFISNELETLPTKFKFNVICGLTGTRKTENLIRLEKEHGKQILDLEHMANHRGSVLGAMARPQPSQKLFETRIVAALRSFDPSKPVWIEAESTKVGNLFVPKVLWQSAMQRPAKVFELISSLDDRVDYLLSQYQSWHWQQEQLKTALESLNVICGKTKVKEWQRLVDSGNLRELVKSLLVDHYDVRYKNSKTNQAVLPKAKQVTDIFAELGK